MTERITSMPAQVSVTCVQLPGQESELAHGEMANTSGGCILPGEDLFEHDPLEPLEDIIDDICDTVSEWWASW
ncbi:MAG: hypothetical protein F4Y79_05765 [Gemmatimonadetes bacterium]|nr:hypothetical protein [Gemmatimonadota bacterium]MXX13080.1 hypothetical protein [Gemmatimonadota bacterium]MXZ08937.1 hypothetical protein [Gemmatimonadota bacterium]MYB58122.1 hypothetical protein [Gemmatimonadota bacterium]MYC13574.1 hypothetical protein [Gemmatimonadota bacterium]